MDILYTLLKRDFSTILGDRYNLFEPFLFLSIFPELRKEKTDISNSICAGNGNDTNLTLVSSNELCQGGKMSPIVGGSNQHLLTPKLERPTSLGGTNKISRKIINYRGEQCKY